MIGRTVLIRSGAIAGVVGSIIAIVGSTTTFVIGQSSTVPDSLTRFPYSVTTFRVTEGLWSLSHLLFLCTGVAFAAAGIAGRSRGARSGNALAIVGLALLCVGEIALIPAARTSTAAAAASAIDAVFAIAMISTAAGLISAGIATRRVARWRDWRTATPLICGIGAALLVPVVVTPIALLGIAAWSGTCLALSLALLTCPVPADHPVAARMQTEQPDQTTEPVPPRLRANTPS